MNSIDRGFILKFGIIASLLLIVFYNFNMSSLNRIEIIREPCSTVDKSKLSSIYTRDFYSYDCKTRKRIGGQQNYVEKTNDPLWRIDGAWFVCFDGALAPVKNNCNVLSFGVHTDFSFDKEMNEVYGCSVHSFDPFLEDDFFKKIRESDPKLRDSVTLNVNDKWKFHSIGVTGIEVDKQVDSIRRKDLVSLNQILKYTNLINKTIDIFKMDIEGSERSVFEYLDIDYACKYFKQFMFETHPKMGLDAYKLIRKLEKCFYLFHRETRFFLGDSWGPTGHLTEFQNPAKFKLSLDMFKNEIILANYMFAMGELYFLNENFF